MQQAAVFGGRQNGQGVGRPCGAQVRPFERVHGDIYLRILAAVVLSVRLTDLFTDVKHRRLVPLTLADDDRAVDRHGVELAAHGLDGHLVGLVPVALPHRLCTGDRRLFHHSQEVERKVEIHKFAAGCVVNRPNLSSQPRA